MGASYLSKELGCLKKKKNGWVASEADSRI